VRLHSYVVARDYGFAPNPFYGICTLATCKPRLRSVAQAGDWVVGTGSKTNGREKHVVYAMRVTGAMTFEAYWADPRFQTKKPNLRGSKKQACWNVSIERATTGSIVAERTAAVIWSMLALVPAPVFLWNVFPLHPHETGDPFSNRSHKPHERAVGEELLAELIVMLRPRRLVAIGNDAAKTASRFAGEADVVQVRHPSYGGQRDFVRQVRCLYALKPEAEQLALL
jgi:hypothetical protein